MDDRFVNSQQTRMSFAKVREWSRKQKRWVEAGGFFVLTSMFVFEAFGVERLMYGSDWPVCLLAGSYEQVFGLLNDYVQKNAPKAETKILWRECGSRLSAQCEKGQGLTVRCRGWVQPLFSNERCLVKCFSNSSS